MNNYYCPGHVTLFRSSRSQMFFKIGVLKNFAIFILKDLRWTQALGLQLYEKIDSSTGAFL